MSILSSLIFSYFFFKITEKSSTEVCPVGFTETDNVCYLLGTERKSFSDADAACRDLGAHLVEPRTSNINNVVKSLVVRANNPVYIGLIRNNEGTFSWVSDQSPVSYTDWAPSEPQGEECVVMRSDNLGWNDVPCTFVTAYICQASKRKSSFIILLCLSVRLLRGES